MKLFAYPLSAALGFLGVMFVAGSHGAAGRVVVGVVLLTAAVAFLWLALMKPKPVEHTIVQKIDLSGDVAVEQMKCKSCGGELNKDSVAVRAGAVFINCPYCGSSYQLEEAPKW